MDKASVVLIEGNVAGATLLHQLAAGGELLQAIFVDYGQRSTAHQLEAAESQCTGLGIELVHLNLASLAQVFKNVQNRSPNMPVPHRHLISMSIGFSYATNLGAPRLYLPSSRDDARWQPATSYPLLAQFQMVTGLLGDVAIATPLLDLSEAEIIARGYELSVDFSQTYSCASGQPVHCGRCTGCIQRRTAFRAAGVEEPDNFYRV